MIKSFPPIRTPIGHLPSCIELHDVKMRIAVIHFDYGIIKVGYVREDDSPRAKSTDILKIQSEIVNELGSRVQTWLDITVSEIMKNYGKGKWKFK